MNKQASADARSLAGELYQVAGALNAPVSVLDYLAAIAQGECRPDGRLLPFPEPSPVPVPPQDGLELRLLRRQVERMALCPDHRDKATGWCIVCQAEKRTREELRAVPVQAALRAEIAWLLDRLENHYDFECTGGPLKNCREWQRLRATLAASPAPSEAGKA